MTRPTYADFLETTGLEPEGLYPCPCGRDQDAHELYDVRHYDDAVVAGQFVCWTCLSHQDRVEQAEAAAANRPPPSWAAECEIGNALRAERQQALAASDWTQTTDSPLCAEIKQAWAIYRQAWRDMTETFASPDMVVRPTRPF